LPLARFCTRSNANFLRRYGSRDRRIQRRITALRSGASAQNGPTLQDRSWSSRARQTGKNRCPSVSMLGPGKRCTDRGWARQALNHRCRRCLSPVNRRFGTDVQSRRRTCWPYPRFVLASARAYATGLGDSLRNVQSLLSTSGMRPSLRSAQRTV